MVGFQLDDSSSRKHRFPSESQTGLKEDGFASVSARRGNLKRVCLVNVLSFTSYYWNLNSERALTFQMLNRHYELSVPVPSKMMFMDRFLKKREITRTTQQLQLPGFFGRTGPFIVSFIPTTTFRYLLAVVKAGIRQLQEDSAQEQYATTYPR